MQINLKNIATFGVAGNFTGHLEQAGEASDFVNVKTTEAKAPKGIFPTYIPSPENAELPYYLKIYPFDENKIIFPENEEKLQIEPECAVLFDVQWNEDKTKIAKLDPVSFFASNDCSIRKQGAKKISEKKNWGAASKGYAISSAIELTDFSESGNINDYKIASFLIRNNEVIPYGEDSFIKDYSYIYGKLINWMIEKLNNQQNEGPLEHLNDYLIKANCPNQIVVSIGATRYTDFGEHNFLKKGDQTAIILYPSSKYSYQEIIELVKNNTVNSKSDISFLIQLIQ